MPTMTEIQLTIQKKLNRTITQVEIGKALGTGRANINDKIKKNKPLKPEEISKIEKFFNIEIDHDESMLDMDQVFKILKNNYSISDKGMENLREILENPAMLNALFLFNSAIKGDKDAMKILEMINSTPATLNLMYGDN